MISQNHMPIEATTYRTNVRRFEARETRRQEIEPREARGNISSLNRRRRVWSGRAPVQKNRGRGGVLGKTSIQARERQ